MASEYPYNSPYALQENKFGWGVELEGKELQPFYPNIQGELYKSAGVSSSTSANKVGKELLSSYVKTITAIMLTAFPAEELLIGGLGLAVKELGVGLKTESLLSKSATLQKNIKEGELFEGLVHKNLQESGNTNIVKQVTIKANNGVKTRIDILSKDAQGETVLTEAKSSASAPLTKNQKSAFPSIENDGGTIMGKGKPGFEGGTRLPPMKVQIIRPSEIPNP